MNKEDSIETDAEDTCMLYMMSGFFIVSLEEMLLIY